MSQNITHPVASILDHGIIRSVGDFVRLGIVDWTRYKPYWKSPQQAMEIVSSHFMKRMGFLVAHLDLYEYPDRDDFPGWKHAGRHEELGRLYWNHFHAVFSGKMHFHDQPDFSGVIIHKDRSPTDWSFWGDLGQVSPITILDISRALLPHTMWISVLDTQTQVVIEPLLPADANHAAILRLLTPLHISWHTFETSIFIEHDTRNLYLGEIAEIARTGPIQVQKLVKAVLTGKKSKAGLSGDNGEDAAGTNDTIQLPIF
jgi:hypothetical protein